MKLEDIKIVEYELISSSFKKNTGLCSGDVTNKISGEYEVGKLKRDDFTCLAIKTCIKVEQVGNDSDKSISEINVEYISSFDLGEVDIEEISKEKEFKELIPEVINKNIYPILSKYIVDTYKNAKLNIKLPEELIKGE